jgi:hypothetical protein
MHTHARTRAQAHTHTLAHTLTHTYSHTYPTPFTQIHLDTHTHTTNTLRHTHTNTNTHTHLLYIAKVAAHHSTWNTPEIVNSGAARDGADGAASSPPGGCLLLTLDS